MSGKPKRGNRQIKNVGIATRFKPGVSGNPSGKPAMPAEINESRNLRTQEIIQHGCDLLQLSVKDVEAIFKNKRSRTSEALVASLLVNGINGSHQHVKEFLDRFIGKQVDAIDLRVESKSLHMMLVEVMEKHSKNDV